MLSATTTVTELIDSGDNDVAMSLLAICAETLNSDNTNITVRADSKAVRKKLIELTLNATSSSAPSSESVVSLRAATLGLLANIPWEMDAVMCRTTIDIAAAVANSSKSFGSIPAAARSSLVTTMSSVIDAIVESDEFPDLSVQMSGEVRR